ncbi:MAG: hypothetical protein LBK66_03020 [Spirochaetaceae bacterium]|jgi:hypothetical protein|nr:hypothetical protein [Spirochaetaceae bacterium]
MNTLFDLPLVREDNLLRRFEEIHNFIYAHDGLSPQETLEEFIRKVWFNTTPQTCLRLCGGSNKATPTKIWY